MDYYPEDTRGYRMADTVMIGLSFIIALIVSTIIIFVVTKLFGETEGFLTALIAALAGTVIYTIASWLLGTGFIAAFIGGIAWLVALQFLYGIGWVKALVIAVIVWLVNGFVGWFLPTLAGPV
jgi:hypothetical protein